MILATLLDLAMEMVEQTCKQRGWVYDAEGIGTIIEMDMEVAGVDMESTVLSTQNIRKTVDVVSDWEENTALNFDKEMRK